MNVTRARLKSLLHYCPSGGIFTWRVSPTQRVKIGDVAGSLSPMGYVHIQLDGRRYCAHRLAFFYMEGFWPGDQIDHVDCDRSNNRYANLREASAVENGRNRGPTAFNACGKKGVDWAKREKRWRVRIKTDSKRICLGYFKTLAAAAAAYETAAIKHHGPFANWRGSEPEA